MPPKPIKRRSKSLREKYEMPTPVKWRKIGDSILIGSSGLSTTIAATPIPVDHKIWIICVLNFLGVAGKVITNFHTDND